MHCRYYLGHFLDNFSFQEQQIMANSVGHGKMISSGAIKGRVETWLHSDLFRSFGFWPICSGKCTFLNSEISVKVIWLQKKKALCLGSTLLQPHSLPGLVSSVRLFCSRTIVFRSWIFFNKKKIQGMGESYSPSGGWFDLSLLKIVSWLADNPQYPQR